MVPGSEEDLSRLIDSLERCAASAILRGNLSESWERGRPGRTASAFRRWVRCDAAVPAAGTAALPGGLAALAVYE